MAEHTTENIENIEDEVIIVEKPSVKQRISSFVSKHKKVAIGAVSAIGVAVAGAAALGVSRRKHSDPMVVEDFDGQLDPISDALGVEVEDTTI